MRYFILLIFIGCLSSNLLAQPYPSGLAFEVRLDGNTQRQISESTLNTANTLTDLFERYPADWMEKYLSVEITVSCNGEILKATGTSHELNEEQKRIIQLADYGSELTMDIKYIANNNLKRKIPREVDYTFSIIPAEQASIDGKEENLKTYLEEYTVNEIKKTDAQIKEWTTLYFSVNEKGDVVDVEFLKSSSDEKADKIILDAFSNMPKWSPATTKNGEAVRQDFKFYIGDLNLCAFYEG